MARPRQYDEDLRVALIETAARILAEEGQSAVSTRRVATETDTTTAAIYALLGNKRELLRAVFHEGFRRLGERIEQTRPTSGPLERVIAQSEAYFDNAWDNPNLYAVMFGSPPADYQPDDADLAYALDRLQLLVDAVADCVAAGLLAGDPRSLALELWATSHGACMLAIVGMLGSEADARTHHRRMCRAMFTGLATLAPAPPTSGPGTGISGAARTR